MLPEPQRSPVLRRICWASGTLTKVLEAASVTVLATASQVPLSPARPGLQASPSPISILPPRRPIWLPARSGKLSISRGPRTANRTWRGITSIDPLRLPCLLRGPINGGTLVTGASYADGGRSYGTQYYYVVTAVDTSTNQSTASNEVFVTPLASNGSALQFNSLSSQYVTFGSASGLGVTTFTLEAWVKRDAGGTSMGTGTGGLGTGTFPFAYPVLTKGRGEGETPANLNTNYWLGIATTGVIAADFEDTAGGANHPVIGVGTIPVGQWHHIAATYDGQTWRLYLDGVLDATSTLGSPFTPESTSIQHAALGSALTSGGVPGASPGYFAGTIDEVRVWNVARDPGCYPIPTKIQKLPVERDLSRRWGINEGSGTTIADSNCSALSMAL